MFKVGTKKDMRKKVKNYNGEELKKHVISFNEINFGLNTMPIFTIISVYQTKTNSCDYE